MKEKKRIRKAIPAMAMLACFLIGTATGFLTNDLSAGILIGAGTGLILLSILRMVLKQDKKATEEAGSRNSE